jgi:ParB-like chromosome segregation protein Spo0J
MPRLPKTDSVSLENKAIYQVEMRELEKLVPYARNARTHSENQIAEIANSIREWGFTNPLLIRENDGIIIDHGRTLALEQLFKLGETVKVASGEILPNGQVPVIVARGWSEEQIKAYVIADNRLAEKSGWDANLLNFELTSLEDAGFDVSLTGFDDEAPEPTAKSTVKEVATDATELEARFWISLRGPMADQARVLDAIKAALGAPGEVEIDIGVIS